MKFTVIETRRVRSLNQANASGFDTLVTYADEAGRVHTLTIAGDAPTSADIDQAIAAEHGDRTQHTGRVIEA